MTRLDRVNAAAGKEHFPHHPVSASAWRLVRIERDAFTAAAGYPPDLFVDCIRLLDRVWLDFTW